MDELERWNVPSRIRVIIAQGMHPDEPPKPSRSEWLFDAVCGLVRAGVPDPVILSIQMDPGWGIDNALRELGWNVKQARFGGGPVWCYSKGDASKKPVSVWKTGGSWRADYEGPDPFWRCVTAGRNGMLYRNPL